MIAIKTIWLIITAIIGIMAVIIPFVPSKMLEKLLNAIVCVSIIQAIVAFWVDSYVGWKHPSGLVAATMELLGLCAYMVRRNKREGGTIGEQQRGGRRIIHSPLHLWDGGSVLLPERFFDLSKLIA